MVFFNTQLKPVIVISLPSISRIVAQFLFFPAVKMVKFAFTFLFTFQILLFALESPGFVFESWRDNDHDTGGLLSGSNG